MFFSTAFFSFSIKYFCLFNNFNSGWITSLTNSNFKGSSCFLFNMSFKTPILSSCLDLYVKKLDTNKAPEARKIRVTFNINPIDLGINDIASIINGKLVVNTKLTRKILVERRILSFDFIEYHKKAVVIIIRAMIYFCINKIVFSNSPIIYSFKIMRGYYTEVVYKIYCSIQFY